MYRLALFLIVAASLFSQAQEQSSKKSEAIASQTVQSQPEALEVNLNVPKQLELKIEEKERTSSFSWLRALELALPAALGSLLTILGVHLTTTSNAKENEKNRKAAKEQHERDLKSRADENEKNRIANQAQYESEVKAKFQHIRFQKSIERRHNILNELLTRLAQLERAFDIFHNIDQLAANKENSYTDRHKISFVTLSTSLDNFIVSVSLCHSSLSLEFLVILHSQYQILLDFMTTTLNSNAPSDEQKTAKHEAMLTISLAAREEYIRIEQSGFEN